MNRNRILLALALSCFAIAGCKRDAEAPPAPEAAPAAAETAPAETKSAVISEVDHNSPASAAPGFDVKAFAGTYAGGGTMVAIEADGRYTLTAHAESAGADLATKGTWTAQADGKHVLLDPESKDEADRLFEVMSAGELREVEGGLTLKRGG